MSINLFYQLFTVCSVNLGNNLWKFGQNQLNGSNFGKIPPAHFSSHFTTHSLYINFIYKNSLKCGAIRIRVKKALCEAMINAHNSYRSDHSADELVEEPDMSKQAQEYAQHLAESNLKKLPHSTDTENGENLVYIYRWHNPDSDNSPNCGVKTK